MNGPGESRAGCFITGRTEGQTRGLLSDTGMV